MFATRVVKRSITSLSVLFILGCSISDRYIPREELIADTEYLAWIIQDTHPAPYERCGGKEAFDDKLAQTIAEIPEEGMRRSEFSRQLYDQGY
jgi:hypothetical protein